MSAFVDLCFGDFTEEETQTFLSETFSAVLASAVKIVCKEATQSPEGTQSDVASLSNHTEDEPTSSEEPVVFLNQPRKKVKKKIKKRRKSNTQLSGRSSSSEEFTPATVEIDINPAKLKDDESEEQRDASPSSSPVDEDRNADGTVLIGPACTQQLPWSNLNKKSRRTSTSSSASSQGGKMRRKGSRQGSYRIQDAGKNWNEQNSNDGSDSDSSTSSSVSSLNKKGLDGETDIPGDLNPNTATKSYDTTSQANNDVDGSLCTKNKEASGKDITLQKDLSAKAPPPAPKRWSDLFSKSSNNKQEISLNQEKSVQGNLMVSSKPGPQQLENIPPPLSQQKDSNQGKKHVDGELPYSKPSSKNGQSGRVVPLKSGPHQRIAASNAVSPQTGSSLRKNHVSKSDREQPHSTSANLHAQDGEVVLSKPHSSSNTIPKAPNTDQEKYTKSAELATQKSIQGEPVTKDKAGIIHVMKVSSEQGKDPTPCNGTQQNSEIDVHLRKVIATKNALNHRIQEKPGEHEKDQPESGIQQEVSQEKSAPNKNGNHKRNIKRGYITGKTTNKIQEKNVVVKKETKVNNKQQESLAEEPTVENGREEKSKTVEYANEVPVQFVNDEKKKDECTSTSYAQVPVQFANEEVNKNDLKENHQVEKRVEVKEQKKAQAVEPVTQSPWQNNKCWSDVFNKSKPQGGEINTKKPDFIAVNGHEKTVNVSQKVKLQKIVSLEEEQKVQLALDVAEIIQKCKVKTLNGDVPQPRGLINTSNWCYVNSTLQALIACPLLVMCLRDLIPIVDRLKALAPYVGAIVDLLKEFPYLEGDLHIPRNKMMQLLGHKGLPFEPHGIYRALEQLENHLTMAKEHQHDAEEYLTTSLGRIDHELMELLKIASQASDELDLTEEDENERFQNGGVWQEVYKKNKSTVTRRVIANDTPITQIFGGDFRSYVYRNNKLDSSMVEPFLTLSLSVDGGVMCIEEALRKDLGKEDMVGDEGSVTKKLLFERLPKVMIIQLKKFSYDSSNGCIKLKKNLAFYDELTIEKDLMSPYAQYSSEKERTYKLSAVLYHAGRNANCGHYITAAKYVQQWLLFDDNIVRQIALKRVLQPEGKEPYILFYSRI